MVDVSVRVCRFIHIVFVGYVVVNVAFNQVDGDFQLVWSLKKESSREEARFLTYDGEGDLSKPMVMVRGFANDIIHRGTEVNIDEAFDGVVDGEDLIILIITFLGYSMKRHLFKNQEGNERDLWALHLHLIMPVIVHFYRGVRFSVDLDHVSF